MPPKLLAGQALVNAVLGSCCHEEELEPAPPDVPAAAVSAKDVACEPPFSEAVTVAEIAVEIVPTVAVNAAVVAAVETL